MVTLAADAALSGEFILTYPGVGSTEPLAHDASSKVFASAIRALDIGTGGDVTVSRSRTGVRGYAWTVTFEDLSAGDRPQLVATAKSSLETRAVTGTFALDVETITDGVEAIGGTFEIAFSADNVGPGGEFTGALPYDVSAREFEAAIEGLAGVDDVTVDVELLDGGDGGRTFSVGWPERQGNVPMLRVNGSGLTPPVDQVGISIAARAYVNEVGSSSYVWHTEWSFFLS